MPEISRFFGIIISMFLFEHEPHFHARYGYFGDVAFVRSWRKILCCIPLMLVVSSCTTTISRSQLEKKILDHKDKHWHRWIYHGTKNEMHYLEVDKSAPLIFMTFLNISEDIPEYYKISQAELKIPRTIAYTRKGGEGIFAGGDIQRVPDIYYEQHADGKLIITELSDIGTTITAREYKVEGDRLIPHGRWIEDSRYDGFPLIQSEYVNGEVHGKRSLDLPVVWMVQQWKMGKPDGIWQIAGDSLHLGEVEFHDGIEVRRSEYGSDRLTDKLLLREWTKGQLTYQGSWVVVPPAKILQPDFYLKSEYMPDTHPEQLSLKWIKTNIHMKRP